MKAGAKRLLDDLRRARVLVVHPQDEDGTALVAHLNRLGCEVRRLWPLPPSIPSDIDTLFVLVDEVPVVDQLSTMLDEKNPAIIAIVTYESPTSLKAIIDLNAHGVISKPMRPLGVLTQFALARYRHGYEARLSGKVAKLEDTLKGRRQVEKATKILVDLNKIDEDAAYRLIRDQATAKRMTMRSVAENIISVSETMSELGMTLAPMPKAEL
ncbi:MAG: ANTAR domain-containing protein [Bradyrhizobium sp.]|nr:MAG: ANTAR domain-containing protein [Bradyrhizobium sp.]